MIISNVPGPKEPLYFNGAKLEGCTGFHSSDRVALNITLVSYIDQLEFGLTACRRTLPSMQRLLDYLENGIKELEVAAVSSRREARCPAHTHIRSDERTGYG